MLFRAGISRAQAVKIGFVKGKKFHCCLGTKGLDSGREYTVPYPLEQWTVRFPIFVLPDR